MFNGPQAQPEDATGAIRDAIKTSFAVGWQMTRLYTVRLGSNAAAKLEEDLPGLSKLPAGSLAQLGLAQADVGIRRLTEFVGSGATLPTTQGVCDALAREPPDPEAARRAILDLHIALLIGLTAADYRLGKAYGLGRALADTCASAHGDDADRKRALAHHLEPHRALVIFGWLDDLKTVLSAHSGQAVVDSLQRWVRWGEAADLGALDPQAVNRTTRVLHRCGQRWRALLSGEKAATDLLEIGDYVTAARGTLARAGAIARSLAWQLRGPLTLATILIGIGIALIFLNNGTAQVLAGLGTVAGGLGITWRSAGTTLGHLSLDLVKPLWGGEVDGVVGTRVTPLPQRDYVAQLAPPKGRLRRAWRELLTSDADTP